MTFNTAVLFLVFNRIEPVKQTFERIKAARPPRLYIASDGPRTGVEGEDGLVHDVRDYIMSHIDWECEVQTLYREANLGCKVAVSSAIDWFFTHEEEGIILEDDCLPSSSFFMFCQSMLEHYREDARIGLVAGFNFGYANDRLQYDYFFSKYGPIWGWASWRRAWQHYDVNMHHLEEVDSLDILPNYFSNNLHIQKKFFWRTRDGLIDTWDYQWSFARLINHMYSIVPKTNMIKNIGFGEDATHTTEEDPFIHLKEAEMEDKPYIHHPPYMVEPVSFYDFFDQVNPLFNFSVQINALHEQALKINDRYQKIVLYGNGIAAQLFRGMFGNKIVAVADMKEMPGVIAPKEIVNIDHDAVVIMVLGREKKVTQFLEDECGIEPEKIVRFQL
jgi:hypothetical protein